MERVIVDVSVWQGAVNWEAFKPHIDGAIIRCSNGATDNTTPDPQFERNAAECERLGIPYGVYVFSYATTEEAAIREAQYALKFVEGKKLSYPIFFDSEERTTATVAAKTAKAFCKTIDDAGYISGIYASASWWNNYLKGVDTKARWVASWGTNSGSPQLNYKPAVCDIWQYTSNGTINGQRVDMSLCYVDYPAIINPPEPEPEPEFKVVPVRTGGNGAVHSFEQPTYCYTYEQYEDGRLVYHVSDFYNAGVGKTYGSGYFVEKTLSYPHNIDPAAPAFIDVPFIQWSIREKQNLMSIAFYNQGKDSASFWAFGTQKAIPRFCCDFYLEGRWK